MEEMDNRGRSYTMTQVSFSDFNKSDSSTDQNFRPVIVRPLPEKVSSTDFNEMKKRYKE